MKNVLPITYLDKERRLAEIDEIIAELDEKLRTPARTLEDIICHIELLKEREQYL